MTVMPSVFVSHGSPLILQDPMPSRDFLLGLARDLPRPKAVLVYSAHWMRKEPRVTGAEDPGIVYDFSGFPDALYDVKYPVPGDPAVAEMIVETLRGAGFETAEVDPRRPLDHGAWTPLSLVYPKADIPVLQLSMLPSKDLRDHWRLGRALAPLREAGILVVGSGGVTHNLRAMSRTAESDAVPEALALQGWVADRVERGDLEGFLSAPDEAIDFAFNHPTPEHFWPLAFSWGAGGESVPRGRRLHQSLEYGALAMDAYAFS